MLKAKFLTANQSHDHSHARGIIRKKRLDTTFKLWSTLSIDPYQHRSTGIAAHVRRPHKNTVRTELRRQAIDHSRQSFHFYLGFPPMIDRHGRQIPARLPGEV
ncbi:hypothetical protein D3C85_1263840 [compost metagenome]